MDLPCLAFKIGVRQVVERHRRLPVEQRHETFEQVFLDGLAMACQQVGGAIELHQGLPLEIHAQQLSGGAARSQPEMGPPLGAGLHQAHRDGCHRGFHQFGMAGELLQQILQSQFPQRPEAESLDARGANPNLVQAVLVHRVRGALFGLGRGRRLRCGAGKQSLGDEIGFPLQVRIRLQAQVHLSGQQGLDTIHQGRPLLLGNREMAAKVEQGALAHLVAFAPGLDQSMTEIGFGIGFLSCGHASDIHERMMGGARPNVKTLKSLYGTTIEPQKT